MGDLLHLSPRRLLDNALAGTFHNPGSTGLGTDLGTGVPTGNSPGTLNTVDPTSFAVGPRGVAHAPSGATTVTNPTVSPTVTSTTTGGPSLLSTMLAPTAAPLETTTPVSTNAGSSLFGLNLPS